MITSSSTLSNIVRENPGLANLFETLTIDYCCGGSRSLEAACKELTLDPQTVVTLLNAALVHDNPEPAIRYDGYGTQQLVEHIMTTYHSFLKRQLPRLVDLSKKVAASHGDRDPRLLQLQRVVEALAQDLLDHLDAEEQELFPLIMESDTDRGLEKQLEIQYLLSQLESEHRETGKALEQISQLSDGHKAPPWACPTMVALFHSLEELARDIHQHVHIENNILFPRFSIEKNAPKPNH